MGPFTLQVITTSHLRCANIALIPSDPKQGQNRFAHRGRAKADRGIRVLSGKAYGHRPRALGALPDLNRLDHFRSVTWRSSGQEDPWLCVPPLQMVCLCRGTRFCLPPDIRRCNQRLVGGGSIKTGEMLLSNQVRILKSYRSRRSVCQIWRRFCRSAMGERTARPCPA
jgi:hypothetical protein